jgi:hypothetical protein
MGGFMKNKKLINIYFTTMLSEMTECIKESTPYPIYYWYHEDKGYLEIVECDLFRGRIIMEDGDFSEFDWELEESHIYREELIYEEN